MLRVTRGLHVSMVPTPGGISTSPTATADLKDSFFLSKTSTCNFKYKNCLFTLASEAKGKPYTGENAGDDCKLDVKIYTFRKVSKYGQTNKMNFNTF